MGKPKTAEEQKIYEEIVNGKNNMYAMMAKGLYRDETTDETWEQFKKRIETLDKEF